MLIITTYTILHIYYYPIPYTHTLYTITITTLYYYPIFIYYPIPYAPHYILYSYIHFTLLIHYTALYRCGGDNLGVGQIPHIQGADRGRTAEPGAVRETGLVSVYGVGGVYGCICRCIVYSV